MTDKKKLTPTHKWRWQNLERLAERYGSLAEIARKANVSEAYLSQIRNRTRTMGHPFAADLEKGLGLEPGWLSTNPDRVAEELPRYETGADERLKRVIEAWPSLTQSQKDKLVRDIDGLERSNQEILKDLLDRERAG